MRSELPWQWYGAAGGEDSEHYTLLMATTREEALAEAEAQFDKPFTVVEARKRAFRMPTADDVIGWWTDHLSDNDDLAGEDGVELEGTSDQQRAAIADLDRLLENWAERHSAILPDSYCFSETRNSQTVEEDEETEESET